MDIVKQLIAFSFLALSFDAFAGPVVPLFGLSRAGATSTVTLGAASSAFPAAVAKAPAGSLASGVQGLGIQAAANNAKYTSNVANMFPGLSGSFGVASNVASTALSASAAAFIKSPKLNAYLLAGSVLWAAGDALYDYYKNAGVVYNPADGSVGLEPMPIVSPLYLYGGYSSIQELMDLYAARFFSDNGCAGSSFIHSSPCPAVGHGVVLSETSTTLTFGLFSDTGQAFYANPFTIDKTSSTNCPSGYQYSSLGGECYLSDPSPAITPASTADVQQRLDSAPPVSAQKQAETLSRIGEIDPSALPVGDAPQIESVPSSETSAPQTSVSPDGAVQTTTKTVTATKTGPQTATVTETTSVKTTPASSVETTVSIQNAPSPVVLAGSSPSTDSSQSTQQNTDPCTTNPGRIGCSEYGTAPDVPPLDTVNALGSLDGPSIGEGTCPADTQIVTRLGTISWSWSLYCEFAAKIRPVLIAIAYIVAAFIILK